MSVDVNLSLLQTSITNLRNAYHSTDLKVVDNEGKKYFELRWYCKCKFIWVAKTISWLRYKLFNPKIIHQELQSFSVDHLNQIFDQTTACDVPYIKNIQIYANLAHKLLTESKAPQPQPFEEQFIKRFKAAFEKDKSKLENGTNSKLTSQWESLFATAQILITKDRPVELDQLGSLLQKIKEVKPKASVQEPQAKESPDEESYVEDTQKVEEPQQESAPPAVDEQQQKTLTQEKAEKQLKEALGNYSWKTYLNVVKVKYENYEGAYVPSYSSKFLEATKNLQALPQGVLDFFPEFKKHFVNWKEFYALTKSNVKRVSNPGLQHKHVVNMNFHSFSMDDENDGYLAYIKKFWGTWQIGEESIRCSFNSKNFPCKEKCDFFLKSLGSGGRLEVKVLLGDMEKNSNFLNPDSNYLKSDGYYFVLVGHFNEKNLNAGLIQENGRIFLKDNKRINIFGISAGEWNCEGLFAEYVGKCVKMKLLQQMAAKNNKALKSIQKNASP